MKYRQDTIIAIILYSHGLPTHSFENFAVYVNYDNALVLLSELYKVY